MVRDGYCFKSDPQVQGPESLREEGSPPSRNHLGTPRSSRLHASLSQAVFVPFHAAHLRRFFLLAVWPQDLEDQRPRSILRQSVHDGCDPDIQRDLRLHRQVAHLVRNARDEERAGVQDRISNDDGSFE